MNHSLRNFGRSAHRRRNQPRFAPVAAETFEARTLLTAGPSLLTPVDMTAAAPGTPTVDTATPVFSWEAIDTAVNYELWVSDMENRSILFIENGLTTTNFTPTTELPAGRVRAWVRANLSDGSTTDWSGPSDFIVQVQPEVTGPGVTTGTPTRIDSRLPTVTWNSGNGYWRYEIFVSNQTDKTSKIYTVQNLLAQRDADGNVLTDADGRILREEVRSMTIPDADSLAMADYATYVRGIDWSGRTTDWSAANRFTVAPKVNITRPTGPTFQDGPLLEWDAVTGATHYQVWVSRVREDGSYSAPWFPVVDQTGTSLQLPDTLPENENFIFWVRARRIESGITTVNGLWSDPSTFSSLRAPVVFGPADEATPTDDTDIPVTTAIRPTLEWTPIDGAVRYDIWLDRTQGPAEYLRTTSATATYTLTENILPGNYFLWVRANSATGEQTSWSVPYRFTATAGAPSITGIDQTGPNATLPIISWTPVTGAASYNVWISYIGVDYDFIVDSGITTTEYIPLSPLNAGTYRVWVQAVQSDGTTGRWSAGETFTVVETETAPPEAVLTSLHTAMEGEDSSQSSQAPEVSAVPMIAAQEVEGTTPPAAPLLLPTAATEEIPLAEDSSEEADANLVAQLAADMVDHEWWAEEERQD